MREVFIFAFGITAAGAGFTGSEGWFISAVFMAIVNVWLLYKEYKE